MLKDKIMINYLKKKYKNKLTLTFEIGDSI